MKSIVALTVVVTSFITSQAFAESVTVSASRMAFCQSQLTEAVNLCKLQATGAEECFLDAMDNADHCASKKNDQMASIAH